MGNDMKVRTRFRLNRKSAAYMKHAAALTGKDAELKKSFQGFSIELEKLNQITGELETSGRILEKEDFSALKKAFDAAAAEFSRLNDLISRKKNVSPAFIKNVRVVGSMLSHDHQMFLAFDPDRKRNLADHIDAAQALVVDLSEMKDRVVKGAVMSARIGLKVKIKDRYTDGLFTQEKHHDADTALENALKRKNDEGADAYTPEFRELIRQIDRKCQERKIPTMKFIDHLRIGRMKKGVITLVHEGWDSSYELPEDLDVVLDNSPISKVPLDDQYEIFDQLAGLRKDLADRMAQYNEMDMAGIPRNSRIDQRNSAVSAVAELLGMQNEVAKSQPMIIKDKDGMKKGTFMQFISNASDSRNLKENDPLLEVTPKNLDRSSGMLKSAADLQVLDFICGNVDRHSGNVMYRVDDKDGSLKVTGLIGIDNDTSFGIVEDDKLLNGYLHLPGIRHMTFMRKSTADILKKLTPEALREALAPYDLSEAEQDAACHRLTLLKESMDECYLNSPDTPDFSRLITEADDGFHVRSDAPDGKPRVYVLDDRQIEGIKASHLNMEGRIGGTDNQFNLFSKVRREVLTVQDLRRKNKTSYQEDNLPEVPSLGGKLQFGPARYAEKLKGFIEDLEHENKGFFIGSAEYDNVLAFAKVMHTELSHIESGELPPMSREQLSCMFETMNALAQVYLDKKAQEDLSKERNASLPLSFRTLRTGPQIVLRGQICPTGTTIAISASRSGSAVFPESAIIPSYRGRLSPWMPSRKSGLPVQRKTALSVPHLFPVSSRSVIFLMP